MFDTNNETQSDSLTNNEQFLDFFNFDFNFEDQDKKKTKKIMRQQETSQTQKVKNKRSYLSISAKIDNNMIKRN